jgi:hypothetical protein
MILQWKLIYNYKAEKKWAPDHFPKLLSTELFNVRSRGDEYVCSDLEFEFANNHPLKALRGVRLKSNNSFLQATLLLHDAYDLKYGNPPLQDAMEDVD